MAGIVDGVLYGKNADFSNVDGNKSNDVFESHGLFTNGQIWIGSTATNLGGTHINVGSLTSPSGTLSIGYSSPNITIDLVGGSTAIDTIALQTGTSPVSPTVGGLITFNGAVVAAGTNPVRTDGTGANTYALEVQTSQAIAAADATKIGLSNFDSSSFAVAATGFVTLTTTGAGKTITGDSGGALSPTANNWNLLGNGSITTAGSGSTLTTQLTGLTNHAVLVGAGTTTITKVGPTATAGQILQSAGSSADPVFSTATYPSTAGTSGNLLISNGTNFVSTAPTIVTVSGQLTSAQIKALHGTPIQILAAPGAANFIRVIAASASFNYGGSNVFVAGAAQTINLYFGTTTSIINIVPNAMIVGAASTLVYNEDMSVTVQTARASFENLALNWYNPIATEITGNAANNNFINYTVTYIVTAL